MNKLLVSIPIVTYNSAAFIVETLESVKAQTYQNIELIVSDDGSTDDTVTICREWIAKNKDRFVRAEVLTTKNNTGVSGNLNRAETSCQGEWVKFLDGDDLLLPTCVEDYIEYVTAHPEIVYLFGRGKAFGASEERNRYYDEKVFDYAIFGLEAHQQYQMLTQRNCIISSTCMYNRKRNAELGLYNDERIPLLEDWPRWINVTKKGIKLYLLNKVEVKYRLRGNSLSTSGRLNPKYYRSQRMFSMLYQYPEWYKEDPEKAAERVVEDEMEIYQYLLDINQHLRQLEASKAYRLGKFLLKPLKWLRRK